MTAHWHARCSALYMDSSSLQEMSKTHFKVSLSRVRACFSTLLQ
jgi:hypothetical protein